MNNIKKANIFVCLLLFAQVSMPYALSIFIAVFYVNLININYEGVLFLNQLFCVFIPVVIFKLITKIKFRDIIPLKRVKALDMLLIVLITIFLIPLSSLIGLLTSIFVPNTVSELISGLIPNTSFINLVIVIAITPAVFEEIATRGLVLSLYKNCSYKSAIIINGLFFAFFHLNIHQFFYTFFLGIVFSYFVKATGSIISSIVAHFTFNFINVALPYIIYISASPEQFAATSSDNVTLANNISTLGTFIVICVIFSFIAWKLLKIFRKRNPIKQEYIQEFLESDNNTEYFDADGTEYSNEVNSQEEVYVDQNYQFQQQHFSEMEYIQKIENKQLINGSFITVIVVYIALILYLNVIIPCLT